MLAGALFIAWCAGLVAARRWRVHNRSAVLTGAPQPLASPFRPSSRFPVARPRLAASLGFAGGAMIFLVVGDC